MAGSGTLDRYRGQLDEAMRDKGSAIVDGIVAKDGIEKCARIIEESMEMEASVSSGGAAGTSSRNAWAFQIETPSLHTPFFGVQAAIHTAFWAAPKRLPLERCLQPHVWKLKHRTPPVRFASKAPV